MAGIVTLVIQFIKLKGIDLCPIEQYMFDLESSLLLCESPALFSYTELKCQNFDMRNASISVGFLP